MPDDIHRSVRVLVASSAAGTRTRLRSLLASAGFSVTSESTLPDAEDIASASPDVIIADADIVRGWHASHSPVLHAALVVLTDQDDEAMAELAAERSEVWGLVSSRASAGEVRAVVEAVLHGHVVLPATLAARLTASLSSASSGPLDVEASAHLPDAVRRRGRGEGDVGDIGGDEEPMIEPLTAREREVLRWLGEGLSNRAIAERLSISEHTVKFHISSIYGKLGASSRLEAVVRGRRQGLISL